MKKVQKTNAARLLDRLGAAYDIVSYEVDEQDLSATHLARQLDEDPARVFKTLVLCGDKNGHLVCVIPGDSELDLKKAAAVSGNKRCTMVPMKELFPLTGYIRGGCSPVGMKKHFPTYIHTTINEYPTVYVSAGLRGLQLKLAPVDLMRACEGTLVDLASDAVSP